MCSRAGGKGGEYNPLKKLSPRSTGGEGKQRCEGVRRRERGGGREREGNQQGEEGRAQRRRADKGRRER